MLLPLAAPLLLQCKIAFIQMNVLEKLENNRLQSIRIPLEEASWKQEGKEILINARLFDVRSYTRDGDQLIVTGIFDDDEMAVEKEVDQFWQQQPSRKGILLVKSFEVLSNMLLQHLYHRIPVNSALHQIHFRKHIDILQEVFIKIPSPPPQS